MVQNLKAQDSAQQGSPAGSRGLWSASAEQGDGLLAAGFPVELSQLRWFPSTAVSSLELFCCLKQGYSLSGVHCPLRFFFFILTDFLVP